MVTRIMTWAVKPLSSCKRVSLMVCWLLAMVSLPALCFAQAGELDPTFGSGGLVTTDFFGSNHEILFRDGLAVQVDGKIVVVGTTVSAGGSDFGLARYNPDGSLDASFGNGGLVSTDFNGSFNDLAYSVALQADGKIVVAGLTVNSATGADFALARYDTDGSLDASFGNGGLVTTDFNGSSEVAYSVALQADGKIVVAGLTYSGSSTGYDFALARYNADGSLDATFGTGGLVTTDFNGSFDDLAYSVALQADGKIVVAGSTVNSATGNDFAMARYFGTNVPENGIVLVINQTQDLVTSEDQPFQGGHV